MFSRVFQRRPEEGQGLVEYALILVLVAITVIVVLSLLGSNVSGVFFQVDTALSGQSVSGSGTEYVVGGFSASSSGGPAVCNVQTSDFTVTVLQNGEPAANQSVSVSISATGGGASSVSATTNASGQASFSGQSVTGNCSGRVTISAGSSSREAGY